MSVQCPRCGASVAANVTLSGRIRGQALSDLSRCANRPADATEWNPWINCPDLRAEVELQTGRPLPGADG